MRLPAWGMPRKTERVGGFRARDDVENTKLNKNRAKYGRRHERNKDSENTVKRKVTVPAEKKSRVFFSLVSTLFITLHQAVLCRTVPTVVLAYVAPHAHLKMNV